MLTDQQRQELAQRIEKAFSKAPRPANHKVGDKEELESIIGKKRKEISVEDLVKSRYLISFNREGLRYYLPVYLIMAILRPDEMGEIIDDIVSFLLSRSNLDFKNPNADIRPSFTPEERTVIGIFLEKYEELFPNTNDSYVEFEHSTLEKGIKYWKNYNP